MTDTEYGDVVWEQAVGWIMREHEKPFDQATRETLQQWLATPAHAKAYAEARTLWLVTGLVPSSDEQSDPPPE